MNKIRVMAAAAGLGLLLGVALEAAPASAAEVAGSSTASAATTASWSAGYGNVRNGGTRTIWVDQTSVRPGETSRQAGDPDANYLNVPGGYSVALWQIASSGGRTYWAWKGCYSVAGSLPLGDTSYFARLMSGWGCGAALFFSHSDFEPIGPLAPAASPGAGGSGSSAGDVGSAGRLYPTRLSIGIKQAYGRSLYTIERQRGYSPDQARRLAQRIVDRIYPGAWWADGYGSYTRGIYVPLYTSVFYYR